MSDLKLPLKSVFSGTNVATAFTHEAKKKNVLYVTVKLRTFQSDIQKLRVKFYTSSLQLYPNLVMKDHQCTDGYPFQHQAPCYITTRWRFSPLDLSYFLMQKAHTKTHTHIQPV